jgi:hypothetical protein
MIQVEYDNWDDFPKEADKLHKLEIKLQQQLLIPDNVEIDCGFETIQYKKKKETIRRVSFFNEEKENTFIIYQDGMVVFLLDDEEDNKDK